ncbi:hypothetical protein JG677_01065 [Campylobacter sp. TTU-622]|uniref:hypothetical protein n=1 Tax=unclassified Campylobacter TaxID=2593542 RepID=UPI001906A8EF|nr:MULTISPECIES: hypothetical protein [unclassified Campylobacter]MBK1971492.1 hypothetical protein [Campylobacter sp. TTU_617]MBK1972657.1 hypothetical protein [Campylobacter sp. TTU-622]
MSIINPILPIQIEVLAKSGYGHYTLLINNKKVQTKSMIELEVGVQYLVELYNDNGGIIEFKNLYKKPNIAFFEEGLSLITSLLEEEIDFKKFILQNLIECKDRQKYHILKEMLFASFENIYHIPFVFENKAALLQMKKDKFLEIYLFFSVFGPLRILIKEDEILIKTPFLKVQKFLSEHLKLQVLQDVNIKPLFIFKKLFDFKG